jgi:hypothetical protein
MINRRAFIRGFILAPFFIYSSILAEDSTIIVSLINTNEKIIAVNCNMFDISPSVLSAIIYVERSMNYNWSDEALDIILAKTGHNSSIGFCQVKLKTAYWIEIQLSDSSSSYYPGVEYSSILPVSQIPGELISKLKNDSLNILYAAAYLRIIQSRWDDTGHSIDTRPDIIGTLYSTGLFYSDGTERIPRKNPEANIFGIKVKEALQLFHKY